MKALTAAYEAALQRSRDLGLEKDRNGLTASDAIARHIVDGARHGTYDPEGLADGALEYLQGLCARNERVSAAFESRIELCED